MIPIPSRVLVVIATALAVGLAWLWFDKQGNMRGTVWTAPQAIQPDIKIPAASAPVSPSVNPSTLERPLFAPDRRPPPPPAPPAPPPPPDPLKNLRINGIVTGEVAGILANVDGKIRHIKLNGNIGPWSLTKILEQQVTFTQGDQNREFTLTRAKLGAPKPSADASAQTKPSTPVSTAPASSTSNFGGRNIEEEMRESLRRRNEIRAALGFSPATR